MHRLIIDDTHDYQFFGIVTHEADYKTSLKLNEAFNISLKSDTPVVSDSGDTYSFSRFTSRSRFNDLTYQLVSNRSDLSALSKNFPALDYLFVICGTITIEVVEDAKKKIKNIPGVTAVFVLQNDQLTDEKTVLQIS